MPAENRTMNRSVAPPVLVSIVPSFRGGRGHVYGYHCAIGEAVTQLGWRHIALVTPDPALPNLPPHWYICLDQGNTGQPINPLRKLGGAWCWFVTINQAIKKLDADQQPTILFFEGFGSLQLSGLAAALALQRRSNLYVWLLYYTDVHRSAIASVYKTLNKLIKAMLPSGHFQLLTDSELLAKSLTNSFGEAFQQLPMLPSSPPLQCFASAKGWEVCCWWPGEPRWEKGLEVMQHLVKQPGSRVKVAAAADAGLRGWPGGPHVELLPKFLTPEEYSQQLAASHIILLPYDPYTYQERTSGIFLESILASKILAVSRNTWMARQLAYHDLDELAVDWYRPNLWEYLVTCTENPVIAQKITRMQQHFQEVHSVAHYGTALKKLFERTLSN